MSTADLQPSKLGTREHWDDVYDEEIRNFKDNGEEGEIWFGQESVDKMVDWALENVPVDRAPSILEVGSGNGTLLFALADKRYPLDRLSGIDYSSGAIELAQSISESRGYEAITFNRCDFLREDPPLLPQSQQESRHEAWDLILDKGTFDAIALMGRDENGNAPVLGYPQRVFQLLKPGGYFLITSCNFTETELQTAFDASLEYHSRIQHRVYTFGGKSGSVCSSVAFRKPVTAS
ncbi:S-adenosyl-L-methionine-dependent methyltransferase [Leucogyrophana mollusca]|uniref:S-adenosyl-L-methionine-dependent methyltransferase n=1 Tax=Leucogyrophana mollusca TaxID=85980 RepID=A0ACB8BW63_9AGAM|nr:S-adenosyl-L-methionine-dependent methyltransferase [Leucogyrophana mollusca]